MEYKSVKGFSGIGQLGILLVFLGLGFILAAGAQMIIAMKMVPSGTSLEQMGNEMMKAMTQPNNLGYARLAQVLGTLFLFFIPAVLASWVTNGRNKFWLGFNPYVKPVQIIIGFVLIFAANILASPLEDFSKAMIAHLPSLDLMAKKLENTYNEQVLALSNLKSWGEFIMAIFIMAFFPALFEEVFFRGALQNLLERWWQKPLLAIVVTSLIFSLIHMSVYLFLSRAVLGFVLGLMYHKTKNIWVNVIAHFLNNTIAVIQLFYLGKQKQKIDVNALDPKVEWWVGLVALGIAYFLFVALTRFSRENKLKILAREKFLLARDNTYDPFAKTENI